jgi:hypothetical protein
MGEASGLNRLSLRTGRYQRFGRKTDAKSQQFLRLLGPMGPEFVENGS